MSTPIIFHIDVNNAFLSWDATERLRENPDSTDLRTIPCAVGGDKEKRHGIILAKSAPAKKYGIKTAETIADALKKCPDLLIIPPRFPIYKKHSHSFFTILSEYTDLVEKYSIDEAFMDMTSSCALFGEPIDVANQIRERIKNELGFTVNIGVSTNKLLAKMASDFKKPDHVHTLYPEEISTKMWPLPVSELFFVGSATCKKLHLLGIDTIGDLATYDKSIILSHLGKHGDVIYNFANGIDDGQITTRSGSTKGVGNSTTIDHDVTDANEAKQILLGLCEKVSMRLRDQNLSAYVVSVTIKDFQLHSNSHQLTLLSPTNLTNELYTHVCQLFDELWDGKPIRLLGVQTSKVTDNTLHQFNLFEMENYQKESKLESALDELRDKFGKDIITRANTAQK